MIRVLITGGSGALGQAVIKAMVHLNCYQIFATTSKPNINVSSNVTTILCDLRNLEQLTTAFDIAKPDLILHLGASFTQDITEAYEVNVVPAKHLLQLIHIKKSNTRIVLIGSAAEYGVVSPEENPINEDHALFPVSVYGVSKAWQTQLLGLYVNHGVDVVCARIFNLYGPGISERLFAGRIYNQINAIKVGKKSLIEVGSLSATRDYISIHDAARLLLTIAKRGILGNIYHIGSGVALTMREFLISQLNLSNLTASLIKESPDHSNHNGYDVPVIFADMQKTRRLEIQE